MKKIQAFFFEYPWVLVIFTAFAICTYVIIAGGNNGFKKFNELQALKESVAKK